MTENKKLIQLWSNDKKRKAFLKAYQEWGLWLEIPELNLSFYRYQMPDKSYIVAMEYMVHVFKGYEEWYKWEKTGVRYYVLKAGEPFSPNSLKSCCAIMGLLKNTKMDLQKDQKEGKKADGSIQRGE